MRSLQPGGKTGSDERRRNAFLAREGGLGGQELVYGVHWDAKRGRGEEAYGRHLIRSLLDRHPDRRYTILERARGRPGRPGQIRSDQTGPDRQTSVMLTCALFVGIAGEKRLLPSPSSSDSKALVTSGALCLCV